MILRQSKCECKELNIKNEKCKYIRNQINVYKEQPIVLDREVEDFRKNRCTTLVIVPDREV